MYSTSFRNKFLTIEETIERQENEICNETLSFLKENTESRDQNEIEPESEVLNENINTLLNLSENHAEIQSFENGQIGHFVPSLQLSHVSLSLEFWTQLLFF